MRELVADLFVSADGWAKGAESGPFFDLGGPGLTEWIERESAAPQVMVMGRVTFELLAESSRGAAREEAGSDAMTRTPKIVFSDSLESDLGWANSTLLPRATRESVEALKREDGDALRVVGSLTLVREFLRQGTLDRLRLLVFPLLLGRTGEERVFDAEGLPDAGLGLAGSQVLDGRLVLLDYRVG